MAPPAWKHLLESCGCPADARGVTKLEAMTQVAAAGDEHPFDRLEEVIVKVTTYAALAFLAFLLTLGAITREGQHFLEALNPAVPALTGIWMLRTGNSRVLGQMIPSAITIALLTGLADVGAKSGALLGLLSMGIAGSLMVRRFAVPFIVSRRPRSRASSTTRISGIISRRRSCARRATGATTW